VRQYLVQLEHWRIIDRIAAATECDPFLPILECSDALYIEIVKTRTAVKSVYCRSVKRVRPPQLILSDTSVETSDRLGQIAQGSNPDFRDMAQVFDEEATASKSLLDALTQKTKHLQVKGFIVRSGEPYLFCTCVDSNETILHQKEGSVTKSYADLFICSTAVTATLQSLENVFLKSSV